MYCTPLITQNCFGIGCGAGVAIGLGAGVLFGLGASVTMGPIGGLMVDTPGWGCGV